VLTTQLHSFANVLIERLRVLVWMRRYGGHRVVPGIARQIGGCGSNTSFPEVKSKQPILCAVLH